MDHRVYVNLQRLLASRTWARKLAIFDGNVARSAWLGEGSSRQRGRGMDFEEVRLYQAGDDIRSIDWKVSARSQQTYTKVYREEKERPVILLIDQRSKMFFASSGRFKSVLAAEAAAAIAWASLASSDRVGGLILGDAISHCDLKRGKSGVLNLLTHLVEANHALPSQQAEALLADALERMSIEIPSGASVFVISDFSDFDERSRLILASVAKKSEVTLLKISDPLEESLPDADRLPISDGRDVIDIRFSKAKQRHYQSQRLELENQIKQLALAYQMRYSSLSTRETIHHQLMRLYSRV